MFYIFLSGCNSRTIQDIKFKFSAVLSLVEATKCVKFQSDRYTGFKIFIFRICPIPWMKADSRKSSEWPFAICLRSFRYELIVISKIIKGHVWLPDARSRMQGLGWARAGIQSAEIVLARPIFYFLFFFQFLVGSVMDINILYQYNTTFNFINGTIKNIAINTGRLWRRPVFGQSEIVCMVAILDVQGNTAISLCRERSLARRRALGFRKGVLSRSHCWTRLRVGWVTSRYKSYGLGKFRGYSIYGHVIIL